MSLLNQATGGKQIGPQIHLIQGVNKVGKTQWACSFPKPFVIDLERGSLQFDVKRLTPDQLKSLKDVISVIKDLKETNHGYETLVVDSIEALEGLIFEHVCAEGNVDSIEKYESGYGKGYQRSREIMREIMISIQDLKSKGITTVLVAHTQSKTVTDPATNQSWDRVIMRANDKLASVVRDLSDNIFYASHKVFATQEKGGKKSKAFGDGQRVMYTQWRPGFDAGTRLNLPFELPLSYEAFIEACNQDANESAEQIISDIKEMSVKADDKLKPVIEEQIKKFKNNTAKLREVRNRLMTYVSA